MADALLIDPDHVGIVWKEVAHLIKTAMEKGDLGRFDALESDLLANQAQLWVAWDDKISGAAVTQLILTERSKVCMIQACGGESINNWIGLIADIEQFARAEGCNCVRLMGRKGWMKKLKDYRQAKVVMERRL